MAFLALVGQQVPDGRHFHQATFVLGIAGRSRDPPAVLGIASEFRDLLHGAANTCGLSLFRHSAQTNHLPASVSAPSRTPGGGLTPRTPSEQCSLFVLRRSWVMVQIGRA